MSGNPDYITGDNGDRLITDKLLAKVFAQVIDELIESSAEVGEEDIFSRQEWLAIIKLDIARLPNKLPAEFDEIEGGAN
jgi:hypothetical protein